MVERYILVSEVLWVKTGTIGCLGGRTWKVWILDVLVAESGNWRGG
jgi:hypothetical protein